MICVDSTMYTALTACTSVVSSFRLKEQFSQWRNRFRILIRFSLLNIWYSVMKRSTCFGCFHAPDVATREISWPNEQTKLPILFEQVGPLDVKMVKNFNSIDWWRFPSSVHFSMQGRDRVCKYAMGILGVWSQNSFRCHCCTPGKFWIYQNRKETTCLHIIFQVCLLA